MSATTRGWTKVPLGSVLLDVQPGYASGKHNSEGRGIPHLRPMNVSTDGAIDRSVLRFVDPTSGRPDQRLRHGDVLFNNTNSPELVGKTALFEGSDTPAFSNHMTRLRVNPDELDPGFLALRLHQAWREGWFQTHCNNHVSQASISRTVLRDFEIELPPLDVQRAIARLNVSVATTKASAVNHLAAARRLVLRLRQSVLAAACSGRLTSDWREERDLLGVSYVLAEIRAQTKHRRPTPPPRTDELAVLPLTWEWASVGEIARVELGGTPSRKEPAFWTGHVPWVSSGEVANCRISDTRETITEEGLANSSAKLYPVGTVLIAMIGEGRTRGQSAILDIEAATNQNAAGLIPNCTVIAAEYLWRWALAQYEVTRAVGRGGNQPALNKQKVKELVIPLPPLEEQDEIVRRLTQLLAAVDQIDAQLQGAARRAERASPAAFTKAFRGELTSIDPGGH